MSKYIREHFIQIECLMKAKRFSDEEALFGSVISPIKVTTQNEQLKYGWIVPKGQSFEEISEYPELISFLKNAGYNHVPDFRAKVG